MDLKKDEKFDSDYKYSGYCDNKGDNDLYFDDGELTATAYSYEIATSGTITLDKKQTREVYEFMKRYYEQEKE